MSNTSTATRTRLRAAAGLLGMAAAFTVVTGVGPVPSVFQLTGATQDVRGNCDEPEHAGDAACVGGLSVRGVEDHATTSSTAADSSTLVPSAGPSAATEVRHHDDATEVDDSSHDGSDDDATEVDDSSDDSSGPDVTEVDESSGHGSDDTVADDSSGHGSDDGPLHD